MFVKIPWDKYEAVILLEGWLSVKAGASKEEIINFVSYSLRYKAVNQGVEIDSTFRNTNGIKFQLMSMASAYEETNMGKVPTKLFLKTVELYNNDRASYLRLKEEAFHMIKYTSLDEYLSAVGERNSTHAFDSEKFHCSSEIKQRCQAVLSEEFTDGYRIGDYMHRMRFLSSYEERYGEEFIGELDDLLKSISNIRDGRVFFCNDTDNTLLSDIHSDIEQAFENGATSIHYECLFEKYAGRLAAEMSIYTADALKTVLQQDSLFAQEYRFLKMGIAKQGVSSDTRGEIKQLLKNSPLPMPYDEIKEQLWYVTTDQIRKRCVQIPECVCVAEGTYFYAPNFCISAEEKISLVNAMRSAIASKGYLVAKNLREVFRNACPSAAMDSEHFKDYAIRDILGVLLHDDFSFSSSVITEKGVSLDYGKIFRSFAAEREHLSLSDLDMLKDDLGLSGVYWQDVFSEVMRISKTEMVRKGIVRFDIDASDKALDEMCPGEYMPIKDFVLFLNLPPASVRWNGFLLESYLREYSKEFRLVQLGISKDDYYGLMLKRTSELETYDDIAADMLARNDNWSDEKSALRLLVDMKFQPRAKKSNIGELMKRARQIRMDLEERR